MTLTEILTRRRSCRKFEPRPVSRETIETLLKLALTAPSSKNVRSSRFMVVTDPAAMERISHMRDQGAALIAGAPCAIVVCGDGEASDLWVDNAAISATILQLAAQEAGLGSCWVHVNGRPQRHEEPQGPDAEAHLRTFLPIPAGWRPLCVVALGYPLEAPRPRSEKDDSDKWLMING
ncbi:MAG: nitroreductase family protein [Alistipes sp.]|jgi:nitroreductase|nr:nitroreductase family protein [Alistipes sp.]